jgi:hypothetical protein
VMSLGCLGDCLICFAFALGCLYISLDRAFCFALLFLQHTNLWITT